MFNLILKLNIDISNYYIFIVYLSLISSLAELLHGTFC